ncbi:Rnf6 [Symbiodinium sp. CCMP2456]|nr:Rnf6 [Symbiodinium sp. CCMP2456]
MDDVDVESVEYGPQPAPHSREPGRTGHELEVVNVHMAGRAQRRVARHAAAARLDQVPATVISEAVSVEEPFQAVVSSDEEVILASADVQLQSAHRRLPERSRSRLRAPASIGQSAVVELDPPAAGLVRSDLPSFYVHIFEYGDIARCCSACREFFLPGQLRLGFLPETARENDADASVWLHAPRCIRRSNFAVTLTETLAFAASLPDAVRARVMEELGASNARQSQARWPGSAQNSGALATRTRPWRLQLQQGHEAEAEAGTAREAREPVEPWSLVRVPLPVARSEPASRPGLAARAARSALTAGLEARWAAIDAQLNQAESMAEAEIEPATDTFVQRQVARVDEEMNDLLTLVPCQKLESRCEEPCAVCYEDMTSGDDVRRLPCLHYFHMACIDKWLRVKATCPLDNLNVRELIQKQAQ